LEAYLLQIGSKAPTAPIVKEDLNNDGAVNITDVMIVAAAFNSARGDGKYVESSDLNGDGAINIKDVMMIAAKFNTVVLRDNAFNTGDDISFKKEEYK
jgi:hypothetical protein